MILTVKEQQVLNDKIKMLCEEEPNIEWVSYDENFSYRNTDDESLLVGLGYGDCTKHLSDSDVYNDIELTYYYGRNILYYMTIFRMDNKLRINVHKTNNPQVNRLNLCTTMERIEV